MNLMGIRRGIMGEIGGKKGKGQMTKFPSDSKSVLGSSRNLALCFSLQLVLNKCFSFKLHKFQFLIHEVHATRMVIALHLRIRTQNLAPRETAQAWSL